MKVVLGIEYLGHAYCGWQLQKHNKASIQFFIERSLSQVADEDVHVCCAGRTDKGVHAFCQVIHFETNKTRSIDSWVRGTNSYLPNDICILWGVFVDQEFHARFSATRRTYQYVVHNTAVQSAVYHQLVTWYYSHLDLSKMQAAAQNLIGQHDFSSFRAVACQAKSPIRTIDRLDIIKYDNFYVVTISANAFLYHMVRNIMGVLLDIGSGQKHLGWELEVLRAQDRTMGGVTAPATGLYLANIEYPISYGLSDYIKQVTNCWLLYPNESL